MIETYKILQNLYDSAISPSLPTQTEYAEHLRGNDLKLLKTRSKQIQKMQAFPSRIVSLWNSLPNAVVKAPTLNTFKNRLDRFWDNLEVKYVYQAEIIAITGGLIRDSSQLHNELDEES